MSKYVRQERSQRKHPVASSATSLIRAPAVPAAPKERPGWKGPGFIKKTPKSKQPLRPTQSACAVVNIQEQHLPAVLQQLLLNVFRITLPICQDYGSLKLTLQDIRTAISEGNHEKAFSRLDWLEAYTVRWSPNRALCCATILLQLCEELPEQVWIKHFLGTRDEEDGGTEALSSLSNGRMDWSPKAVCFGGGAAEIMAFAAVLRHLRPQSSVAKSRSDPETTTTGELEPKSSTPALDLHLVDLANWAPVISSLESGLITPPVLSKYASQAAKSNNAAFILPGILNTSFLRSNILTASQEDLVDILGSQPLLITLFFTLNDLHSLSTAKTAAFLLKLTLAASKGSLLLVVDSAESLEVAADKDESGKDKKTYTMHNLLDLVLLEKHIPGAVDTNSAWEALVSDRSRLFKLDEGLKFPVSLENIRCQVHLFKRR